MVIFIKKENGNILVKEDDIVIGSYSANKQILKHPSQANSLLITDDTNNQEVDSGLIVSYDTVDKSNCIPVIVADDINSLITSLSDDFFFRVKTYPSPVINIDKITINKGVSNTIILSGSFFTPESKIDVLGEVIVESVVYIDGNNLRLNLIGSNVGLFDLKITNISNSVVYNDFIEVVESSFIDLSSNGITLTIGSSITNDIRHNSSLNVFRDALGLGVSGTSSNWSDWITFNVASFNRGDNKITEIIFTSWSSTIMLGIGSDASDEVSTQQFSELETSLYINTPDSIYGLYGNDGTPGSLASQPQTASGVLNSSNIYKLKITSDGGNGSLWQLFELPNSNKNNWKDESNLVYSITSILTPDESNLMPEVLPRRLGSNGRIIAIK
jgi:hypothetical protein